jgi:hypothetical protein
MTAQGWVQLLNVLYQFTAKDVRCRAIQYLFYTGNINKLLIVPYYLQISLFRGGGGPQGLNSENQHCVSDSMNKSPLASAAVFEAR